MQVGAVAEVDARLLLRAVASQVDHYLARHFRATSGPSSCSMVASDMSMSEATPALGMMLPSVT